ncbi:hypothetical protein, partial [Salmonella enterica]|uniref:hypothetical protein n=1 Tax=Salmonella enterica TaxID=28901 RepID=UPI003FA6CEB5
LKCSIWFQDATQLNLFLNQTAVALEINAAGAVIANTGVYKYGFDLIFPKLQLLKPPIPKGNPNDGLTQDLEFKVMDDLVHPSVLLYVYTAQAAYL